MSKDRIAALLTGVLLVASTAARAQVASTPQGDILRGQGQFLRGAAWYELRSAQARAIDAHTAKVVYEWNREVYNDYRQARAEHLGYKKNLSKAQQEQAKREMGEKEHRLRTSPTSDDVVRGDALNALLVDLCDPAISDSQWRYAKVPLPEGLSIRSLVFQFVPRMKASAVQPTNASLLAMGRLDAEGRWPIYLPEDKLSKERTEYEAAYRVIRDQCLKGNLSIESVGKLDQAIDALKSRAATEVPIQRDYRAYAARFVDDIRSSAKIFDAGTVALAQEMIADMQGGRDAQTVGELLAFMRKYRLLFASAEKRPEDGDKYRQLYGLLRQQKEAIGLKPPDGPLSSTSKSEDLFRVGSVWEGLRKFDDPQKRGESQNDKLIITRREGNRFVGELHHEAQRRKWTNKVEGTIAGSNLNFSETGEKGVRFYCTAVIDKNNLTYKFQGTGAGGKKRSGQGHLTRK